MITSLPSLGSTIFPSLKHAHPNAIIKTTFPFRHLNNIPPTRRLQFPPHQPKLISTSSLAPSPAMAPSDSQTLLLPDGRSIGYAEYGSSTGHPFLYFHGYPSSRLEAYALDHMALKRNIRLLALDRPGFGLSSPSPKRNITDYPSDVQAFASQLKLGRFMVLGVEC